MGRLAFAHNTNRPHSLAKHATDETASLFQFPFFSLSRWFVWQHPWLVPSTSVVAYVSASWSPSSRAHHECCGGDWVYRSSDASDPLVTFTVIRVRRAGFDSTNND